MKRAIIIGASSGIGRKVSELLLSKGYKIAIAARRKEKLQEVKSINPPMVEVIALDVTKEDAREKLLSLIELLGGVDLFFYASGWGRQNLELSYEVELSTISLNVKAFTLMIDTVFDYMAKNKGGDIAAISSIAGTKGIGVAASYSATKAFQAVYLQALDQLSHIRKLNIRIIDIRPGFVDTSLLSDGNHYPLMMSVDYVARKIIKAIETSKSIKIIDYRYRILVFLWRCIPNFLWRKLNILTKKKS